MAAPTGDLIRQRSAGSSPLILGRVAGVGHADATADAVSQVHVDDRRLAEVCAERVGGGAEFHPDVDGLCGRDGCLPRTDGQADGTAVDSCRVGDVRVPGLESFRDLGWDV